MTNAGFIAAIAGTVFIACALMLGALWIGGGREAVVAQRRALLALFGAAIVVAAIVGLASAADPRTTGLVVGLSSLVVLGWAATRRGAFPRWVTAAAAAMVLLSVVLLLLIR